VTRSNMWSNPLCRLDFDAKYGDLLKFFSLGRQATTIRFPDGKNFSCINTMGERLHAITPAAGPVPATEQMHAAFLTAAGPLDSARALASLPLCARGDALPRSASQHFPPSVKRQRRSII